MSLLSSAQSPATPQYDLFKLRRAATGPAPSVLADVYADDVNIAVWRRSIGGALRTEVENIINADNAISVSMTIAPQDVADAIMEAISHCDTTALSGDVSALVGMFCDLFELKRVGLRLVTLSQAMCPRFHTDMVPCRLITTYSGVATEWLPHAAVNRSRLGQGNGGLPDEASGLFASANDVQQVRCGDVALLKGEGWAGNEDAGLVHRSPAVPTGGRRLLLTVDFSH